MGIDFNKMKNKVQTEEKKGQRFTKVRYWNPSVGNNSVRLLPPWTKTGPNADDFCREVYIHWGVGDNGSFFACPERTPGPTQSLCPICAYCKKLKDSGDPADAELALQTRSKRRFYSNVIDLTDPVYTKKDLKEWETNNSEGRDPCPFEVGDSKVQVFSYGATIYKELLNILADDLDVTDPMTGYNMVVKRDGKGITTEYSVRLDIKAGAHPLDWQGDKDLEDALVNLDAIVTFKPVEELAAAVGAGRTLPASKPAPTLKAAPVDDEDDVPVTRTSKSKATTLSASSGVDDLEAEMRAMLKEEDDDVME